MYTSILLVALSVTPAADVAAPSWSTDYGMASKQSATAKKPLAVVLGAGEEGYEKLDREGKLTTEAKGLLASKYVCVYVNTDTPEGRRLAKAFEMSNGRGLIISDRSGDVQAFRHEGDLKSGDLVRYLERYSNPEREVRTTEGTTSQRSSSYEPSAPTGSAPLSHFNSSYRPSCSRGR
jgi:hypothetical protein